MSRNCDYGSECPYLAECADCDHCEDHCVCSAEVCIHGVQMDRFCLRCDEDETAGDVILPGKGSR